MVFLIPIQQNSNCLHQQLGVPQGYVIEGPVLFDLYTTPLSDVIEHYSIHLESFAYDTQLRKSVPPHRLGELVQSLHKYIHDINKLN